MNSKQKNNATADKLRISGNEYYSKGKYFYALLNYNHSLCYAEQGSEQMGFAYANRSAVYFELKQFDLCLQNIQLAKPNNYPQSRMDKLIEREEKCKEPMETSKPNPYDDPLNFFKLSYPASQKYPGIADCIELRNNKKFGNHLVTKRALKPGDVIAIEDPSFTQTSTRSRLYRCSYCCKDVRLNLIPCLGCAKVMFCSVECSRAAWSEIHQYECNQETNPVGSQPITTTMRMLLKYLDIFDGNVLNLKKFLEDNKNPVTVFDFYFSNPNWPMYEKNMMLVVLSMRNAANSLNDLRPGDRIYNFAFIDQHPQLKELWSQHGDFLNELLEKLFVSAWCATNISISTIKPFILQAESAFDKIRSIRDDGHSEQRDDVPSDQRDGIALYPAVGLMNGSCVPNVEIISVSNKAVLIAIRPIGRLSQLFVGNSLPFWEVGPVAVRQKMISDRFGYTCDCIACKDEKKWVKLMGLPATDPYFTYQDSQTKQQAKDNIIKYARYISFYHELHKPTHQVWVCISNLIDELKILAKPSIFP